MSATKTGGQSVNLDDLAPLTSHQRRQKGSAAVSFHKTEPSTRHAPGVIPVDHTNSSGLELKVQRKARLAGHGNLGAEAGVPGSGLTVGLCQLKQCERKCDTAFW